MNTLVVSRKADLVERAGMYHHATVYVTGQEDYIKGLLHAPKDVIAYQGEAEAVVDPEGLYTLATGKPTINNPWRTAGET